MDRSQPRPAWRRLALLLAVALLLPSTGCLTRLLATGVLLMGGGDEKAECEALEGHRVAILCRPPASMEYRYAGTDRDLAKQIGLLLTTEVKNIDVVDHRDIEDWIDQKDWNDEDMHDLAEEVGAEMVLKIDLDSFSLLKGQTLRQGRSEVSISLHDMENRGRPIWSKRIDEFLFPANSAVPIQEKSAPAFRRLYISMLAEQIARKFYDHDRYLDVAIDGLAHR